MEIKEAFELEELLREHPAVLVYFYNDNCAPCKVLRPRVQKMVEEDYPEMRLVFVNAGLQPALAASWQIYSAPALLVMFDGKEVIRESKYVSVEELSGKVSRYYSLYFS